MAVAAGPMGTTLTWRAPVRALTSSLTGPEADEERSAPRINPSRLPGGYVVPSATFAVLVAATRTSPVLERTSTMASAPVISCATCARRSHRISTVSPAGETHQPFGMTQGCLGHPDAPKPRRGQEGDEDSGRRQEHDEARQVGRDRGRTLRRCCGPELPPATRMAVPGAAVAIAPIASRTRADPRRRAPRPRGSRPRSPGRREVDADGADHRRTGSRVAAPVDAVLPRAEAASGRERARPGQDRQGQQPARMSRTSPTGRSVRTGWASITTSTAARGIDGRGPTRVPSCAANVSARGLKRRLRWRASGSRFVTADEKVAAKSKPNGSTRTSVTSPSMSGPPDGLSTRPTKPQILGSARRLTWESQSASQRTAPVHRVLAGDANDRRPWVNPACGGATSGAVSVLPRPAPPYGTMSSRARLLLLAALSGGALLVGVELMITAVALPSSSRPWPTGRSCAERAGS